MKTIARASSLFFVLALAAAPVTMGCASAAGDENTTDEESSDEGAITAAVASLAGTYESDAVGRPPRFVRLALHADRTFEATVDNGRRCFRAPCNAGGDIAGTYTAGSTTLTLKAGDGADPSEYYGRYKYARTADGFELTRSGALYQGWKDSLTKAPGILPDDATKIVAESAGGGFGPPLFPGSTCRPGQAKFALDLQTKKLDWENCNYVPNAPAKMDSGSKTLTAAQVKAVTVATGAASIYSGDQCGADKPLMTVKITAPSGTKKYTDSFYACGHTNETYIEGIGEIFSAMRDVAN